MGDLWEEIMLRSLLKVKMNLALVISHHFGELIKFAHC